MTFDETREYTGMLDDDGEPIYVGDKICFSFGIPPIHVTAPVEKIGEVYWAMTPQYTPKKCSLKRLKDHVGNIYLSAESMREREDGDT